MYRIIITFFCFLYFQAYTQTLQGPLEVCESQCLVYSVDNASELLYWEIAGGRTFSNQGSQVRICWQEAGPGLIIVNELQQGVLQEIINEAIQIESFPKAEVLFPIYPVCSPPRDSIDEQEFKELENCIKVCPGVTATYSPKDADGLQISWTVEGAVSQKINGNNITVTWPESGNGYLSLVVENDYMCADTVQYCIEVIEKPDYSYEVLNSALDLNNLCKGQEVHLKADSEEALDYIWISDGGYTYTGNEVILSYDTEGPKELLLVVSAPVGSAGATGGQECVCKDTTIINFIIQEKFAPSIDCLGPICVDEEATYSTPEVCGNYLWTVSSHGTIVEGGASSDNYITVEWGSGPYGSISLVTSDCDSDLCNEATHVTIPIIESQTTIYGPAIACKSGSSTFSAPLFSGATYNWIVSNNGYISGGYGTNDIEVTWFSNANAPNESLIELSIDHCFLECSSVAQLQVQLKPEFVISGDGTECEGDAVSLNALESWNNVNVDWSVTTPDGTDITLDQNTSYISSFNYEYGTGLYVFTAANNSGDYCNTEQSAHVVVSSAPPTVSEIEGPIEVCPNIPYVYTVTDADPNYEYRWLVRNDNMSTFYYGQEVILLWQNPSSTWNFEVTAIDPVTGCQSKRYILDVVTLSGSEIIGESTSCLDQIATYSLKDIPAKDADWSINPPEAGTLQFSDSDELEIHWHLPGKHTLKADYCAATFNLEVEVLGIQVPSYNAPEGVCPGEEAIVLVQTNTGESFNIYDEEGNSEGNTNPINLPPGFYLLEFTNAMGCVSKSSLYIDSFEDPQVTLSSLGWGNLCVPNGQANLEALSTNEGLEYKWTFNGASVGSDQPKYLADSEGAYSVQVINKDGCKADASVSLICIEGNVCTCRSDGGTRFEATQGNFCNEYKFKNTSFDFIAGSLQYNFGDPGSGANNISRDEDPTHTFSTAGHFIVTLSGQVPSTNIPDEVCGARFTDYVTVEAVADFDYLPGCSNSAIVFEERSSFLPDFSIDSYAWDFDDPSSGALNNSGDKDPQHVFSGPGDYEVTLTITMDTGCKATIQKTVSVSAPPAVDIVFPASLCVNEAIECLASGNNLVSFEWDFDDIASGVSNNSMNERAFHIFSTPGRYNISLTAKDVRECENSISVPIDISQGMLTGEISSDKNMPLCQGDSTILAAPPMGVAYVWSTGETTPEIKVKDAGVYTVTVTGSNTCEFIPEPIIVNVIRPINPVIRAIKEIPNSFASQSFTETIEICQGERFSLRTNYLFNATYKWSIGSSNSYVSANEIPSYQPGDHYIYLTVTDPDYGCEILADPLHVIVHPNPDVITIVSDQPDNCADKPHTLSVSNPDPQLTYHWNNGVIGESVTVHEAGYYYVQGMNQFGCTSFSNGISIHPLPSLDGFISGCHEVCFPQELCISNSNTLSAVQWYLNGAAIPSGTDFDFVASEAGEYHAELTNIWGCSRTTEVLSLTPETKELSISGLVFLDNNENGVYDSDDTLLENIQVVIQSGTTVLQQTTTLADGTYTFDPAQWSNATLAVDTAGLFIDPVKSMFEFDYNFIDCDGFLEVDFPLIKNCQRSLERKEVYTCDGEPINISGVLYYPTQSDTLRSVNASGCDSLFITDVLAYTELDYDLSIVGSCGGNDNGALEVIVNDPQSKLFSLNGGTSSSDVTFSDLPAGMHTVNIIDEYGCTYTENFEIPGFTTLDYMLIEEFNCDNVEPGSITIVANANIQISLDNSSDFAAVTEISNIPSGVHTIHILDENGCTYSEEFTIANLIEPDVVLVARETCPDSPDGSLEILSHSPADLSFSLEENGLFQTVNSFNKLDTGDYVLYILDANSCMHEQPFTINSAIVPEYSANIENSCDNSTNGIISIEALNNSSFTISFEGGTLSQDLEFTDLAPGNYPIEVHGNEGCIIYDTLTVDMYPELELEFTEPLIECDTRQVKLGPEIQPIGSDITYLWDTGETDPDLVVIESGTYSLEVRDRCNSQTQIWDIVLPDLDKRSDVYIPNVFDPALPTIDGKFRAFVSKDRELLEFNLLLTDKWGNKIFSSNDPEIGWNGMFDGKPIEIGVYVWMYKAVFEGCRGDIVVSDCGDITILR